MVSPSVADSLTSRVVEAGHSAVLPCSATGVPAPTITWLKDGVPLAATPAPPALHGAPERRVFIISSASSGSSGSLNVSAAKESDMGRYECVAENKVGSQFSAPIQLYVKVRRIQPSFTLPATADIEVPMGGSANLSCAATGSPMPRVRWRPSKEDAMLSDMPLSDQPQDDQDDEDEEVNELMLVPEQVDVPGEDDDDDTENNSHTNKNREDAAKGDYGSAHIHLHNIKESVNYTCVASSSLGVIHSTTRIKVQTLPGAPTDLRATDISSTNVKLEWRAPADGPGEYVLQYRSKGSADGAAHAAAGALFQEVKGVSTVYYALRSLAPGTKYEARVIGVNTLGRGPPSDPGFFTTLHAEDSPFNATYKDPEAPRGLQVRPLSSTTLLMQWEEPLTPKGLMTGYRIYYTTQQLLPLPQWSQQVVDDSRLSTVSGLTPHQVYYVRVQALTAVGAGSASMPALVKTQQGVPGSPTNFNLTEVSTSWARLEWSPPFPLAEHIVSYEVYWNDTYTRGRQHLSLSPESRGVLLETLYPASTYVVWVAARSPRGEGAPTAPIQVKTKDMEVGAPQEVRTWPINTTAVRVEWKAPQAAENLTRGYLILLQATTQQEDAPLEVEVGAAMTQAEAGYLQPETEYSVRVAALVRDSRGVLSAPDTVRTRGGVPLRGHLHTRWLSRTAPAPAPGTQPPALSAVAPPLEVTWLMPPHSPGPVIGYRLTYGPVGEPPRQLLKNAQDQRAILDDLERGVQYELKLAARTQVGWGQDARVVLWTAEGAPTGPPVNVTVWWQAAGVLAVAWAPPERPQRGGNVTAYTATLTKAGGDAGGGNAPVIATRNTSSTHAKAVFPGLEDGLDVDVQVWAHTAKGAGPPSAKVTVRVSTGAVRAPLKVGTAATSQHSAEVWWEPLPVRGKVLGYQVLYTTTPVEDLDEWQVLSVGLTESVELQGLERHADYAVAVAARTRDGLGYLSPTLTVRVRPTEVPVDLRATDVSTHGLTLTWSPAIHINPLYYRHDSKPFPALPQLSWDAVKLFVDAQGITQTQVMQRRDQQLDHDSRVHQLTQLQPFTTYRVNLTAVPADKSYRPPATVTVTTQMAAPQPMVQPALYGVVFGKEIQVILPQASEQFGPISHYYLVVVPEPPDVLPSYLPPIPDTLLTDKLERASQEEDRWSLDPGAQLTLRPYIAARFPQRNIPYTFHLGNNETFDGFRNKPLIHAARYRIFIRAVVDTPQKHLYTSSPYSEPLSLSMRAVPPGAAPRRPDPSVPVERQGGVAVRGGARARMGPPGLLWLVGPLGAALLLCALLVALFMLRRRRRPSKAPGGPDCPATRPLIQSSDCLQQGQTDKQAACDPVRVRRQTCQTAAMLAHPPVLVINLAEHSIEPGQTFTWDYSSLEVNRGKNRYANVVAYDHSRVVLQTLPDVPGSDYINANYCDGYRRRDAYIATQGPMANTFGDFWRMVWETGASAIAMVTRLEERTRVKCHQYWPERGTEQYGPCTVTALHTQELAHYDGGPAREVRQLQFTSWPDHGVPSHPAPFLLYLRRLRALRPMGPLVVHCSAGVGRTGCLVVLDAMLERLQHENTVDVYGHVTCLRAQRNYMVQTEEQYMFIHDALLEAVLCGQSEVSARALQSTILALESPVEDGSGLVGMDLEFKRLNAMQMPDVSFSAASMEANRSKNRLAHAVPYDHSRVILSGVGSEPGADYINASFLDGYRGRHAYIATQGPLAHTVAHFWRMLWQHNCAIIVMLTKLKEQGQDKCAQYWPAERALRYGAVLVEPLAEYNLPSYTLREFKVSDDAESRTIRQFQLSDWPGDALIDFIGQVHKTKEQFGHDGPIAVHCSGGVGRTGVFIALAVLLERMQWEGVVDVLGTVRLLRSQRPAMVSTLEQYRLLYRSSLQYLSSFDHYAA
ncbi:hypothetical protein FOCC_FOCC009612 [Frankliniella occidentalis]|nr:hypothetical protein FOCC_FOCC009612 [Frankliniella occidentalis]